MIPVPVTGEMELLLPLKILQRVTEALSEYYIQLYVAFPALHFIFKTAFCKFRYMYIYILGNVHRKKDLLAFVPYSVIFSSYSLMIDNF